MRVRWWLWVATLVCLAPGARAAPVRLVVWGLPSGEESQGQDAGIRAFEARHPQIRVQNLSMGAGGMNAQKLMTSIAGGVPPDLVNQDRFTIGDWASRDTFRPVDDFLAAESGRDAIRREDYYPACWSEAVYRGRVYAIPNGTDDRVLFWNKKLFREAGLDPERPPRTWEELRDTAVRLTKYRPDGSFERIGFIPIVPDFSNSWLYLYSWQNDGEFMSRDGRTCTLANPQTAEALEYLVSIYDALKGAELVAGFQSTFQPREVDPFVTGKMAMRIDTDGFMQTIARYGPTVEFGVAPAPVPAARLRGEGRFRGQTPWVTWSGGFSYAIPRGARHPREAWEFIRWMNSLDGRRTQNRAQRAYEVSRGRAFLPEMSANRRVSEVIFREFAPEQPQLRRGLQTCLALMPMARFRPVTFVGQRLWDEHVRAFELAIRHRRTPREALLASQTVVQQELDKVFQREQAPLLPAGIPVALFAGTLALALGAYLLVAARSGRVGRLMRGEAAAGLLFAAPWIIGFLVFTLGPILASMLFSLCDYDVLHAPRYVGLRNYAQLLGLRSLQLHWLEGAREIRSGWDALQTSRYLGLTGEPTDPIMWRSLYNALYLSAIGIPLGIVVSLSLAMLLNTKVRGMHWYRTAYYLPSITPILAAALLWPYILNPDLGPINTLWRHTVGVWFGWPAPPWLAGEDWSKPAYILMGLWGAGGGMILWLAGLQGIPQHLYEAADLDGANAWQRFRHVTLPMLTPYLFFNLIMGTIGSLQRFTDVYVMSGTTGAPVDSTMVPVLYLFNNAFEYFKMGYASAWAWIIFLLVLALAVAQLRIAPRWVHYEGERGR
jgi:ABC-type sugar transport system permease subunit/ABC-type glycerol-3-phosphate transport system substrate-binding protein